jgi:dihydroxyacid dehydratase/phosphogluconate dehydratase
MDAKTSIKSRLPSRHVTEGPERAPHRSYLYAMGLTTQRIHQPFVGVAARWNEASPCNISLMRQAQAVKKGVASAGGTPREFCTIAVTDGIAMDHDGMRSSLPSRECIADSVAVVAASGGSTNAALHIPAIAHECGIKFDVAEIFKRTPYVADLKPGGRYVAKDMIEVGSLPLLMKTLLDNGHLHGNCLTVTGRTIAENLKSVKWNPHQDVVRPADKPITVTGGVVGLRGNLAPEGAIVKVAGMSNLKFTGPARCFGDIIEIDADVGTLNVKLTGAELAERKTKWKPRATNHTSGALWKYAQQVGPAVDGAVTHPGGAHEKQCYADI